MTISLKELAQQFNVSYSGNSAVLIDHVCGIDRILMESGGLAYITNPDELVALPTPEGIFKHSKKEISEIKANAQSAIIVPIGLQSKNHNLLFSDDPLWLHTQITEVLHPPYFFSDSISPDAVIGNNVQIGEDVRIDPQVVIYDNVKIGTGTIIKAGAVIMENCEIGASCLIYPNVTIRENCQVGNRVIIQPNAVIGADGFGFFQREHKNLKIPQIGGVIVEDDVEIGASTTIDRARFYDTIIGKGSKLDNLIHIAHNVELGDHSLIAAQSGIAGSTKTGDHLIMGGQSGIKDNLKIEKNVTLLARTLDTSKTPKGSVVSGMPSRPLQSWRKTQALINNLEGLNNRLSSLEKLEREKGKG